MGRPSRRKDEGEDGPRGVVESRQRNLLANSNDHIAIERTRSK